MIAVSKCLKGIFRNGAFAGFRLNVLGAGLGTWISLSLLVFSFYFY